MQTPLCSSSLSRPLWVAHLHVILVECLICLGTVHLAIIVVLSRWVCVPFVAYSGSDERGTTFIYLFSFLTPNFQFKNLKFATFFCDIMTFNNRVSITCFLPADHYICRLWRYITRLVINLPLKTSCPLDCLRGSALINFPFSYGTHAVYSF